MATCLAGAGCGGVRAPVDPATDGRAPAPGVYRSAWVDPDGSHAHAELELHSDGSARLCQWRTEWVDPRNPMVLADTASAGRGTWAVRGPNVEVLLTEDASACTPDEVATRVAPPTALDCRAVDHALGPIVACRARTAGPRLVVTTSHVLDSDDWLALGQPSLDLEPVEENGRHHVRIVDPSRAPPEARVRLAADAVSP